MIMIILNYYTNDTKVYTITLKYEVQFSLISVTCKKKNKIFLPFCLSILRHKRELYFTQYAVFIHTEFISLLQHVHK